MSSQEILSNSYEKGYATILSVTTIMTIAVGILTASTLQTIQETKHTLQLEQFRQGLELNQSCLEVVRFKLITEAALPERETILINDHSCDIKNIVHGNEVITVITEAIIQGLVIRLQSTFSTQTYDITSQTLIN